MRHPESRYRRRYAGLLTLSSRGRSPGWYPVVGHSVFRGRRPSGPACRAGSRGAGPLRTGVCERKVAAHPAAPQPYLRTHRPGRKRHGMIVEYAPAIPGTVRRPRFPAGRPEDGVVRRKVRRRPLSRARLAGRATLISGGSPRFPCSYERRRGRRTRQHRRPLTLLCGTGRSEGRKRQDAIRLRHIRPLSYHVTPA